MITITKRFNNYAFAHRQDLYEGKEAKIHGHNWDFEIILGASELDENGSIFDYDMDIVENHFREVFDHTVLINEQDAEAIQMINEYPGLFDMHLVEDCSCEGIAQNVFEFVNGYVKAKTNGRVECLTVTVFEDAENSAAFHNA